ncbi:ubiquitin thioesterase otubain-like isoform X2 [Copidosoma floridanum]|uniref:ubiquitin thioesterase otubain-like isoform X2 n=1 Tax=Copidosoma floridanum TaxID=29053 RepID=UPI000C6FC848|nr:ubiquitin thioesterase otubain-like isoform X2 [Copidosoma floridanum]
MEDETEQPKSGETTVNQDELILQQQRRIEKEIQDSISLVGQKESLKALEKEYEGDIVYLTKAKVLAETYSYFRKTRPDGNCFFRAFSYAYLEKLINNKEEYKKFHTYALTSKDKLLALGFPKFTVDDFHDTFMEVIEKVGTAEDGSAELHKLFNDQGFSDYVVVYLRLITSGQLQKEKDFYQNFIEGGRTVEEFCHQETEPMYKESDHIHIIAMSSALGTCIRVRYMDRTAGTEVVAHDFPEGSIPTVHLLYRPNHYDILYP